MNDTFERYKPLILRFINTAGGRYLLGLKNLPIYNITPNSVHQALDEKNTLSSFWGCPNVAETFLPTIEKLRIYAEFKHTEANYESFLHFSGLDRKYYKYGDILLATSTFNPSASFEDGRVFRTGNSETWNTMVTSNGQGAQQGSADPGGEFAQAVATATTDRWAEMIRGIFQFDTSSLPDIDVVSAADIQLYITGKVEGIASQSIGIVAATTSDPATLAISDYQGMGTVQLATALTIASISTGGFNTWTLNASGLANISKTGVSKFGTRLVSDITNVSPTWVSGQLANASCRWHTTNGGSSKPVLTVTHAPPVPGTIFMTTNTKFWGF